MSPPPAVVADANVILSALIGGRASLVFASPIAPVCIAAKAVADEVAEHLPVLAKRRQLDVALLLGAFGVIPVRWQDPTAYLHKRREAMRRMTGRDPEDWPTVALALARSIPIWSQDKDMEVAGIKVYTTGDLLDAIRDTGMG